MTWYAVVVAVLVIPLAVLLLRPPPEPRFTAADGGARPVEAVGLPPNVTMVLLALAIFSCCATMSMPMQHMVAFCSDIGIGATHGALMLSVLLGCAFMARQFWGWLSDRIGGVHTILFASMAQAVAMTAFLTTQDEVGLFTVSAAFGLGYAGLIPSYVLAVRALYPVQEASWRVPIVMFAGLIGMAGGGWLAGVLYDRFGTYAPAFAMGLAFNALNLAFILPLVLRQRMPRPGFATG
jgi:MFS family permease